MIHIRIRASQEYVLGRVRQFTQVFAHIVCPNVPTPQVEEAFGQAMSMVAGLNQVEVNALILEPVAACTDLHGEGYICGGL